MRKFLCLLTALLFISLLTGCEGSSKKSWKDVKISELINQQQPAENKSMTVGLHIYLFRIQADKLGRIQYQIGETDLLPVKYNDPDAFPLNGLMSCAGDIKSWRKIAPLLTKARPQLRKHINLMITQGMTNDVIIAESAKPVSVVYRSGDTTAGIGFDAGRIALRIKASPLIGLRQACKLDVMPVYKTVADKNSREFTFESAAFDVRLQPGQFVLLAPAGDEQKQPETRTIGDIISYPQTPKKTADLYLIACGLVNTPL